MNEDQAYRVMMTAHQRGVCVIAVYTRDVAETKAKEATELGKSKGYPLFFTPEPEKERTTLAAQRGPTGPRRALFREYLVEAQGIPASKLRRSIALRFTNT